MTLPGLVGFPLDLALQKLAASGEPEPELRELKTPNGFKPKDIPDSAPKRVYVAKEERTAEGRLRLIVAALPQVEVYAPPPRRQLRPRRTI